MLTFKGQSGAQGVARGTAFVWRKKKINLSRVMTQNAKLEIQKMNEAKARYNSSLKKIVSETQSKKDAECASIYKAYFDIVNDHVFFEEVEKIIVESKVNAAFAIECKRLEMKELFENIEDTYLRERMDDITNVCHELVAEMQGIRNEIEFGDVDGDGIVVFARDLTPSDVAKIDKTRLKGFVFEKGGVTTHTIILAKAFAIPAIVGVENVMSKVLTGQEVLVNGNSGVVIVQPEAKTCEEFEKQAKLRLKENKVYEKYLKRQVHTAENEKVAVCINAGGRTVDDELLREYSDGIGLFRTEFIYMQRNDVPSEEEQFEVYKKLAVQAGGKNVVIRTLDIGADKKAGCIKIQAEENPALGYRGIRVSLGDENLFKVQVRAILRAGAYGNVSIMLPMVSEPSEVFVAKKIFEQEKENLAAEGVHFSEDMLFGVMIETPAAVILSDVLARYVDFFSIGTNDLIQYINACDRSNAGVSYLYSEYSVAVLRAVNLVCKNAKNEGIGISICGEAAANLNLIPFWVAMGAKKLSVSTSLVGSVKFMVAHTDEKKAKEQLPRLLQCETGGQAKKIAQNLFKQLTFGEWE